jgi:hypothetical protein
MKYSFYSLIPILPLLDSIQFSAPRLLSWQAGVPKLGSSFLDHSNDLLCPFITHRHGPRRKLPLYCSEGLLTDPLPSNGYTRHNIKKDPDSPSLPFKGYRDLSLRSKREATAHLHIIQDECMGISHPLFALTMRCMTTGTSQLMKKTVSRETSYATTDIGREWT